MAGTLTFVEHDILQLDAEWGILYQSFEEFWEKRMEPMQFIPREAKGALAQLRQVLEVRAHEQYDIFTSHRRQGLLVIQPTPVAVEVSNV